MKIEITNRQRLKKINLKRTAQTVRAIGRLLRLSSKKISFVFCDNSFIQKLNKKYFKKNDPTDVIAFGISDESERAYLGEVIVSVEQAVRVACDLGLRWQDELLLYLIHGILHLIGYDDRTSAKRRRMERKQKAVLSRFSRHIPASWYQNVRTYDRKR